MFFSVCYYLSLSCTLYNLQISRPSSYNAKLHTYSPDTLLTKDFLSHLFPIQPDDMVICSLNVTGLSNNTKRRETFLWLGKKKFSIYFLQEVHSTKETERYWHSEWGYSTIFATFSSSKAGVAILFNNNFQLQILKHFANPKGGLLLQK